MKLTKNASFISRSARRVYNFNLNVYKSINGLSIILLLVGCFFGEISIAAENAKSKIILIYPSDSLVKASATSDLLASKFEKLAKAAVAQLGSANFAITPSSIRYKLPLAILEIPDNSATTANVSQLFSKTELDVSTLEEVLSAPGFKLTNMAQVNKKGDLTNPKMIRLLSSPSPLVQAQYLASLPYNSFDMPDYFQSIGGMAQMSTPLFSFSERLGFIYDFLARTETLQNQKVEVNLLLVEVSQKLLQILLFAEPILDQSTSAMGHLMRSFEMARSAGMHFLVHTSDEFHAALFEYWIRLIKAEPELDGLKPENIVYLLINKKNAEDYVTSLSNLLSFLESQKVPVFKSERAGRFFKRAVESITLPQMIESRSKLGLPPYTEMQLQKIREDFWEKSPEFSHYAPKADNLRVIAIVEQIMSDKVLSTVSSYSSLYPGRFSLESYFATAAEIIAPMISQARSETMRFRYVATAKKLLDKFDRAKLGRPGELATVSLLPRISALQQAIKSFEGVYCKRLF